VQARLLKDLLRRGELRVPEIGRIVLHPTRLRIVLGKCLTDLMYYMTSAIKEHRP
jgi:hypothetical protein